MQFWTRHYEEHFCEIILNLDHWYRRRCPLKIFLFLELWWHSGIICVNLGRRHHEEQFCEIILNLDQWFTRRYFMSRALAEWNHLCNLSRGHHEEQFFEIILNLDGISGSGDVF